MLMQRVLKGLTRLAVPAVLATTSLGVLSCNQHPVSYSAAVGATEYIQTSSVDGSTKLDILWVVDNSGSMCQEQRTLRENFELFIEEIERTSLDFHIGLTTTQLDNYATEPVAKPGYLQSTPQPVVGFDSACHLAVDNEGVQIPGNYQPVKDAISAAVSCMTTPDTSFLDPSNDDITCALYSSPAGCSITRGGSTVCGGGSGTNCSHADLFPNPSSYRAIPKVLRSAAYKDGNTLDIDKLKEDFGCMALVGTRGYGIEKGLGAAVEATRLDKTGGAFQVDENGNPVANDAPNYGLIRKDARFAVVFVTDENDCTHDGTVNEQTSCGGDVCEYANKQGLLVEPAQLKEELMTNLRETKGEANFGEADILVASIHGRYRQFTGDIPTEDQCSSNAHTPIGPSCFSSNGAAYSGDRYEKFLREFPQFYPTPRPNAVDEPLDGWMCNGDFSPALKAIGEFLSSASGGCITRTIYPCTSNSECPSFPYTNEAGTCQQRPNSNESYCDSALQVRAIAQTQANFNGLINSGYCIPDSVNARGLTNGCVIDYSQYEFVACGGDNVSGVRLQWRDENDARNALLGVDIQMRYNATN